MTATAFPEKGIPLFALLLSALLLGASLAGCRILRSSGGGSSGGECEDAKMTLSATGDLNSNPDEPSGPVSAAVVRVYQLANDANFRGATLESFWQDDRQALGGELVTSAEKQLYPGAQETLDLQIREGVRFVGVAANLRHADRERWRKVYPAARMCGEEVTVTVGANYVSAPVNATP